MLPEADQIVRVMRSARMTREEAEAELARELAAAKPLVVPALSNSDYIREVTALASIQNVEAILGADKPDGTGESGGKKRSVTVDLDAYGRDRAFVESRQAARRQHEEYVEALRARLRRLDEASAPLYAPAPKTPLQRYIDDLNRG